MNVRLYMDVHIPFAITAQLEDSELLNRTTELQRVLVSHVAIQRDGEKWMSNLGEGNDIAHRTPESLESECYGKVLVLMKRKAHER